MKPLNIAVVVGQFPMVSETFIINQIGFLRQSGHQVDILCLGKKNGYFNNNEVISRYNLMENVFVFKWLDLMPIHKLDRLIKATSILFKSIKTKSFFKLIASLNPIKYRDDAINFNQFFRVYFNHYFAVNNYDIIHIHFANNAVRLLKQLKYFENRVVVTFHGYDAHNFDASYYSELLKRNHIRYTVNTEFTKQKVINLGFPENRITILPVGLDTSFFKPNKKEHKVFTVLFVGRLIELKAPHIAINIIEKLIGNEQLKFQLNIIGEGEYFEKCKRQISERKLNNFVTLLGNKSQKELKDNMNGSDVFLFPGIVDKKGRCEAQGLVVQEAQAMELPVLVSNVGGIKEGVKDGETGYVLTENDIDGFADKLEYLMSNPELLKEMGKKGRKFVIDIYDNAVLGENLLKVYYL